MSRRQMRRYTAGHRSVSSRLAGWLVKLAFKLALAVVIIGMALAAMTPSTAAGHNSPVPSHAVATKPANLAPKAPAPSVVTVTCGVSK